MAKFEILTVLGAVFPYFCPDKCEIWHGERTMSVLLLLSGPKMDYSPRRGDTLPRQT